MCVCGGDPWMVVFYVVCVRSQRNPEQVSLISCGSSQCFSLRPAPYPKPLQPRDWVSFSQLLIPI